MAGVAQPRARSTRFVIESLDSGLTGCFQFERRTYWESRVRARSTLRDFWNWQTEKEVRDMPLNVRATH